MSKYCFELYEFGDRGRIFLGYRTVQATSSEDALSAVQEKLDDNIRVCPIYLENN